MAHIHVNLEAGLDCAEAEYTIRLSEREYKGFIDMMGQTRLFDLTSWMNMGSLLDETRRVANARLVRQTMLAEALAVAAKEAKEVK